MVTVYTCLGSDGLVVGRFGNAAAPLKLGFENAGMAPSDIAAIYQHAEGFHLRLELEDVNLGVMESHFMRVHFYRAIEALRHSVAPNMEPRAAWKQFRDSLNIDASDIELVTQHAERHGDYAQVPESSASEVDSWFTVIADIISKNVRWFEKIKLTS